MIVGVGIDVVDVERFGQTLERTPGLRWLKMEIGDDVALGQMLKSYGARPAFLNGRRMVSIPLARTGDSERRQMLSEYALVARNEKASGGVFDLTTS